MITRFMGIEYGRAACAIPRDGGPALAPATIKQMFPNTTWTMVSPTPVDIQTTLADRFAENTPVQIDIYNNTPHERHIMIGGDHSVNFGHFAALADQLGTDDLCMVYVDAHLDIHSPESSRAEASGAPHGCNVRGLMGEGDARWLAIPKRTPLLKHENMFYLGTRSFEPAEIKYVHENNIFMHPADQLQTMSAVRDAVRAVLDKIAGRPFVLSFDFDGIDPKYFRDVWVPENNGLDMDAATYMVNAFRGAYGIEFVEYAPNGDPQSADIARQLIQIAMNQ
ncbi:MAG: arginase family protein [Alphaproteobacteria bacterium]|nr:arginase family protein [Alphaproteobacteria bacterium]